MKFIKILGLLFLLLFTWCTAIYHRSVYLAPHSPFQNPIDLHSRSLWQPKAVGQINQLVLEGEPYGMGFLAGQNTKDLLYRQEKELTTKLHEFFPNPVFRRLLEVVAIRWFSGIENYFEDWMIEEMDGVSKSTSRDFDYLANPLTRQVAYHGLHEVGQMMVDRGEEGDSMGCTVVAVPLKNAWIIGRNFDFEGGRIFDTEKIMKWVFPKGKYAYVSVIWAGMVGAVTGVNEHGLFIALNAAGSKDFKRFGTPSSLLITKALTETKTAQEAIDLIRKTPMFITDIFTVSDKNSGALFRVEKSPLATEVIKLLKPEIITNHLISPRWAEDSVNSFRRSELTSTVRALRGEKLLKDLTKDPDHFALSPELSVLSILRDKGVSENGESLQLGNRQAIDALIATHSVIYNQVSNTLFVSQGPGVSGAFTGFDLPQSFAQHKPIQTGFLAKDPLVTEKIFFEVRQTLKEIATAQNLINKNQCKEAGNILKSLGPVSKNLYNFFSTEGDFYACERNNSKAKSSWRKAQALSPAYAREVRHLKEVIR